MSFKRPPAVWVAVALLVSSMGSVRSSHGQLGDSQGFEYEFDHPITWWRFDDITDLTCSTCAQGGGCAKGGAWCQGSTEGLVADSTG
eukprot:CAMPEP_0114149266 /NCGR_PEP_ID=MMETSP0043_2-20121206/22068_1 /TAXON_ID=464988 /ORGANISM="Hemiselmis andersenii, Strain CCMP644" /LENGTH=86 /DNA_ID=CAMNT_0001243899 /DNA_START=76 /DNA_END=332 /DNA_ORIENTATION=-